MKSPLITSLLVLSLVAFAPGATVFFGDFEVGANDFATDPTTGGYSTTPDASASYTQSNTSRKYNTTLWFDSTDGFGSDRQGLINENSANETAVLPAAGGVRHMPSDTPTQV